MATLNYTTTKSVDQTVGDISKLLSTRGVASISTRYSESGSASGLSFSLRTPHGERTFAIEVNAAGVHALLRKDPKAKARGPRFLTLAHAERVAWRVLKDWLEAQLALIDASMASLDQVMLPYLVVRDDGQTLYEGYREREQLALEA
jgi:hypothetical protein